MNKPRAFVVEDDTRTADAISDMLYSLGHELDHVTNQEDALARLDAGRYDYVLLDLHIPARPNRGGASHEFGVNLLRAIRERHGPNQLPVIIMTAHHGKCVDHTSELTRAGATEFISKPFPETGRTLAAVVRSVLEGRAVMGTTNAAPPVNLKPFAGGMMAFGSDRIQLLGETIAEMSERANYWAVLHALKTRRDDGRFIPMRGTDLARKFKGGAAGENTVSSCVNDLRSRITAMMARRGLKCGKQDVIMSGGPGYRLNPCIKVEERDGDIAGSCRDIAGTCGDTDVSDVPARKSDVPASRANVPLNDRQHWVLDKLRQGVQLERAELEKHFGIGSKTAKRDLSDLTDRGLIEFARTPRPGHYRLMKR